MQKITPRMVKNYLKDDKVKNVLDDLVTKYANSNRFFAAVQNKTKYRLECRDENDNLLFVISVHRKFLKIGRPYLNNNEKTNKNHHYWYPEKIINLESGCTIINKILRR